MKVKLKDVLVDGETDLIDLGKLVGSPVKAVQGLVTEVGGTHVFELVIIAFEDGRTCVVNETSGYPCAYSMNVPGLGEEALADLYRQQWEGEQ